MPRSPKRELRGHPSLDGWKDWFRRREKPPKEWSPRKKSAWHTIRDLFTKAKAGLPTFYHPFGPPTPYEPPEAPSNLPWYSAFTPAEEPGREPPRAEVRRGEKPSLWDVLAPPPEAEEELPPAEKLFQLFSPGREPSIEEVQDAFDSVKRKLERFGEAAQWEPPTAEEMEEWFLGNWKLDRIWEDIRDIRESAEFQEALREAEFTGEHVSWPLATIATWHDPYVEFATFFRIPREVVDPYLRPLKDPGMEPVAEEILIGEIINPTLKAATKAINQLKPRNIPGQLWFGPEETGGEYLEFAYEELPEMEWRRGRKTIFNI